MRPRRTSAEPPGSNEPASLTRQLLTWAGAAAVTVVLLAVLATCATGGSREDLAGWIEALATLAALIAAAVAAVLAERAYSVDRERELKSQAALVAAWPLDPHFKLLEQDEASGEFLHDDSRVGGLSVHLHNASPLPVYDVRVDVEANGEIDDPTTGGVIGGTKRFGSFVMTVLPPSDGGESITVTADGGEFVMATFNRSDKSAVVRATYLVTVSFSDASGARWTRHHGGRLAPYRRPRTHG